MKITFIDGVKGISAFFIFLSHYHVMGISDGLSCIDVIFNHTIISGNLFVCIFLIISSFLICYSYERKKGLVTSMLLLRYFRLSIPISFVLILTLFIREFNLFYDDIYITTIHGESSPITYKSLSYGDLIRSLVLSPFGTNGGWLPALWMMKYIFYGTFLAVLLMTIRDKTSRYGTCFLFSIIFLIVYWTDIYYLCILGGACLYQHYVFSSVTQDKCKYKIIVGLVALLCLIANILYFPLHDKCIDIINALLICFLIFSSNIIQKFFKKTFLVKFGDISFSFYLLHWPFICSFSYFLKLNNFSPLSIFICSIVCLIGASFIWHNLVEKICSQKLLLIIKNHLNNE